MKKYLEFILEYKEGLENIHQKYYNNIDYNDFEKIVYSDPTSKPGFMGKYGKWLLNLYKANNLKLEDLYKATKYLNLFHEFRFKIRKDINQIKSLPELFLLVKEFDYEEKEVVDEDEKKLMGQFKEVFRNDKYRIIIPLTLQASKYFGRETQWCTINTDMFKMYTTGQDANQISYKNLYILYTEDLNKRLQFHFKSLQYMDINDKRIDLNKFFKENKDIYNFFKQGFNPIRENIRWNKTSLEGAPKKVEGNFNCTGNKLTSLEGAPEKVEGDFYCYINNLTSLEGAPKKVEGNFNCTGNNLTSLEGAPEKVEGDFYCYNNNLTSLEGAPEKVEGGFYCYSNNLTSLEGAPKKVEGDFYCSSTGLKPEHFEWLEKNCQIGGKIIK
jgi:uncharacterized protein YjbJ (UPF0337 family)